MGGVGAGGGDCAGDAAGPHGHCQGTSITRKINNVRGWLTNVVQTKTNDC